MAKVLVTIYSIIAPNGKRYVGKAVDVNKRWYQHISGYCDSAISNAIQKYGVDNMKFEILCQVCEEEADIAERFYIGMFNTFLGWGYNLTDGGDGASSGSSNHQYRHDISDEDIVSLVSSGVSYAAAAKSLGCSAGLVYKRLKALGLIKNNFHRVNNSVDTNEILSLMESGMSRADIAKRLNCSRGLIYKRLKSVGLVRSGVHGRYRDDVLDSDIIKMYNSGYTLRAIASKVGVDRGTVKNRLSRVGMNMVNAGSYFKKKEGNIYG